MFREGGGQGLSKTIQLHWLPIQQRIDVKLASLAFRGFNDSLPKYLSDKLKKYEPARDLRSASENLFDPPRVSLKTYGERSFHFAAPKIWNSLPQNLRDISSLPLFKSKLKTHLFQLVFELN